LLGSIAGSCAAEKFYIQASTCKKHLIERAFHMICLKLGCSAGSNHELRGAAHEFLDEGGTRPLGFLYECGDDFITDLWCDYFQAHEAAGLCSKSITGGVEVADVGKRNTGGGP